ncbi:MAG TPA: T9SS type A sorting domain-containing protein, partial [Cytophagales bacterium]|nr:T9SS type A sorting domain-containing protein [Cytophagales bacterium]
HEVYPNPCNEVLHVSDDARIFDMAGHLMTQGRSSIDMSALDAGIYMVKTSSGMVKVMKE